MYSLDKSIWGNSIVQDQITHLQGPDIADLLWLHRETGIGPVTRTIRDCQLRLNGHLAHFLQDNPAHKVVSAWDSRVEEAYGKT